MTAVVTVLGGCAEVLCGDVCIIDFDNLAAGGCPVCGSHNLSSCEHSSIDWDNILEYELIIMFGGNNGT